MLEGREYLHDNVSFLFSYINGNSYFVVISSLVSYFPKGKGEQPKIWMKESVHSPHICPYGAEAFGQLGDSVVMTCATCQPGA